MADKKTWMLGEGYAGMEPGLGCLHDAYHPESGAPALVLTSDARVDWKLQEAWRVSLSCQAESASVKLVVEESPASGQVSTLANMLVLTTAAVTRVEDNPRLQSHLTTKPRSQRSWVAQSSQRVIVGLSVLVLGAGIYELRGRHGPEAAMRIAVDVGRTDFSQEPDYVDAVKPGADALAYSIPTKPYKKQAVPPCQTTLGEEEINGGCWMDMNQRPPCYANRAEHKGKCYMPVSKDRGADDKPSQSVDP